MTSKVVIQNGAMVALGKGCPKHGLGKTLRGVLGKFTADLERKFGHLPNLIERVEAAIDAGRVWTDTPAQVGGFHEVRIVL